MTWKLPGKLPRLLRNLAEIPSHASREIAERLEERVFDCFANEADPYGTPWAPLAESTVRRKGGNSVILYRTGRSMIEAGARTLSGGGVALVAGGASGYHMAASGTRPARPVLPTRGLPPAWREDIAAVLGAEYARAMGRASR